MTEKRFVMPELVISHFHLKTGDKVGDFGAGSGNFAAVLSRAIGSEGTVYACEVQKNLADTLLDKMRSERLGNVEVIWGDFEEENGSKLNDETLDVAVLINTLFQLEERASAVKEIARTLRQGGKFFLIDWSESWAGMGPQPDDVVSENDARSLAEETGLTFERSFDAGDHHYGLAFRK